MFNSITLLLLILLSAEFTQAQFESGRETVTLMPLTGSSIVPGAMDSLEYGNAGEASRKIKNIITFKINEQTNIYFKSGFTAVINFRFDHWATVGGSVVSENKTLQVNYDNSVGSKYNVRAYLALDNLEKVKITVTGITVTGASGWDPLPALQIENEMRVMRYFTLSNTPSVLTPSFVTAVNNTDALKVSWTWTSSVNNNVSQLEWTWVENEMESYYTASGYVQYEQQRSLDVSTINLRLNSISKYYELLKQQGSVNRNPARTLRIKGKVKSVIQDQLTYEALENLYHCYRVLEKKSIHQKNTDLAHNRNIIIVGLMVWQGLHSGELGRLEVNHVNLNEGFIYIPSTARSNSRELKLSSSQILTLHSYIHGGTREKLKPKGEELLPGNMHNTVNLLTEELKGINPTIKNALHIRASVILYWLRQHNKRQVQYMAGHKYIDSTEKYEVQELEELTSQLMKHHPFG